MKNKVSGDDLQQPVGSFKLPSEKDIVSQNDLKKGINTVAPTDQPPPALETAMARTKALNRMRPSTSANHEPKLMAYGRATGNV